MSEPALGDHGYLKLLPFAVAGTGDGLVLVEQEQVSPIEEGQETIGEDQWGAINMDEVDEIHHAAPEAEMPEDGWNNDLLGLLRVDPLQDEATAESKASDETENGPPAGTPIEPWDIGADERGQKTFA